MPFRLCTSRAVFVIVFSLASLITIIAFEYGLATKSDEVAIRGSKALLSQGEAMKATIQAKEPTTMNDISFSAKLVGVSDPFATSDISIPMTVEVYEGDELVASESFTESLDTKFREVDVPINNIPKMDEKYKLLVRYDIPENGGGQENVPIQIDTDSIKVNDGDDGLEVYGRIKIIFPIS
jgi:hypothetical protein